MNATTTIAGSRPSASLAVVRGSTRVSLLLNRPAVKLGRDDGIVVNKMNDKSPDPIAASQGCSKLRSRLVQGDVRENVSRAAVDATIASAAADESAQTSSNVVAIAARLPP